MVPIRPADNRIHRSTATLWSEILASVTHSPSRVPMGVRRKNSPEFRPDFGYWPNLGSPSGGQEVVVDELTWWDKAWLGEAKLGFQKPCIYEKLGGMNGEDLRRNGWWMECITWIDDMASRLCFFASGKEAQASTHSNLS
ncbi:hypothetical protein AgCh_009749 [Apium graveolens]